MRQLLITLLLTACFSYIRANGTIPADSVHTFRFRQGNDIFYVPYKGNETDFKKLCDALKAHSSQLDAGQMYIGVAASGTEEASASRMAYLRNSRVKSELITRAGVTERMFVTDRLLPPAYGADSLRDVVVVTFPADVAKVERIAGKEAAERVRAYLREMEKKHAVSSGNSDTQDTRIENPHERESERERESENANNDIKTTYCINNLLSPDSSDSVSASSGLQPDEAERDRDLCGCGLHKGVLSLRANLLRWATLTPDLGLEYRFTPSWGILVNGSWTSWSWDSSNRRYALWKVSPEVRYYIDKEKRGYLGAMYHTGEFNYKLGKTGKQGDYQGGGITGGYRLELNRALSLDFHVALGYTRAQCDKYQVIESTRVRQGSDGKNYWGINQSGVTLVWLLN